jgi:hypothetical protein
VDHHVQEAPDDEAKQTGREDDHTSPPREISTPPAAARATKDSIARSFSYIGINTSDIVLRSVPGILLRRERVRFEQAGSESTSGSWRRSWPVLQEIPRVSYTTVLRTSSMVVFPCAAFDRQSSWRPPSLLVSRRIRSSRRRKRQIVPSKLPPSSLSNSGPRSLPAPRLRAHRFDSAALSPPGRTSAGGLSASSRRPNSPAGIGLPK